MPRRPKLTDQSAVRDLTPKERGKLNQGRSPSDLLTTRPLCGARRSATDFLTGEPNEGTTCRRWSGEGTDHMGWGRCSKHGGNTRAGKRFAAKEAGREFIESQKARMAKFGGDRNTIIITEEEALLEEVRRSVAMVRFIEERIGEWSEVDLAATPNDQLGGLPALVAETFKGTATMTDQAAWLQLYREERMHAARTSKMAIDAGLQSRLVAIAEDQGRVLATAVKAILAALNLTPEQAALVPSVVPNILRLAAQDPTQLTIQGQVVSP